MGVKVAINKDWKRATNIMRGLTDTQQMIVYMRMQRMDMEFICQVTELSEQEVLKQERWARAVITRALLKIELAIDEHPKPSGAT